MAITGPLWPARYTRTVPFQPSRAFHILMVAGCLLLFLLPGLLVVVLADRQFACLGRVLIGAIPGLALPIRAAIGVRRYHRKRGQWLRESGAPALPAKKPEEHGTGCWVSPDGLYLETGVLIPWAHFSGYHVEDEGGQSYHALLFAARREEEPAQRRAAVRRWMLEAFRATVAVGLAWEVMVALSLARQPGSGAGAVLAAWVAAFYGLLLAQLAFARSGARALRRPRARSVTLSLEREAVAPEDLAALLGEHLPGSGEEPAEDEVAGC